MRISDWSSDVCSSDLHAAVEAEAHTVRHHVGVDAALDEPDGALRAADALDGRDLVGQSLAPVVERGEDRRRGLQRVVAGVGPGDRKSVVEGTSVSVRVDIGGSRIIKKTKHTNSTTQLM